MSSEPASTNTQGVSVSGQDSPPCRHSPVPLFLSWAPLISASGWQCPAIPSGLLNKITSTKRKKECSEKRILSGHTEKREARLPDSMEFLGRKDAWVCSVDGNSGWPTKTKSQNYGSGFYDSLSLALGDTVGLSFSQHTHAWQQGIRKCLGLNGPTCLQSPTVYLGRKWTCLDSMWGVTSAFTSLLSPWWAYWGGTGEWARWDEGSGFLQEIPLSRFFKDDGSGACDDVREGTLEWQYMQVTDMRKYLDPPQE